MGQRGATNSALTSAWISSITGRKAQRKKSALGAEMKTKPPCHCLVIKAVHCSFQPVAVLMYL